MTLIVEKSLKNALVLQRDGIITSAGDAYGITHLSLEVEENHALFEGIWEKF